MKDIFRLTKEKNIFKQIIFIQKSFDKKIETVKRKLF